MKDRRVEEYNFPQQTLAGVATSGLTAQSDTINGDLLGFKLSGNRAGSITIYPSGEPSNLIVNLTSVSGTNPTFIYPRLLAQAPIGSAAGYGLNEPFVSNGPLILAIGSTASGTSIPTFDVRVLYR